MADSTQALGLVETRGLVAAIEAADAMLKAANVRLLDKEITRGSWVTVKVVGETGAVRASVAAGAAAAQKVGELMGTHIIPRPHPETARVIVPGGDDDLVPVLPESKPLPSPDELDSLPVRELREIARRVEGLEIQGRDISRANKQQLLEILKRSL